MRFSLLFGVSIEMAEGFNKHNSTDPLNKGKTCIQFTTNEDYPSHFSQPIPTTTAEDQYQAQIHNYHQQHAHAVTLEIPATQYEPESRLEILW